MKKKGLALILALTLLTVGIVAGTLAWLTAKSDTVTNTFTTSDITVKLQETTGTSYKMIPGYDLEKNPKAWVCLLYTSPSPRDRLTSRMPSSA